MFGYIYITENLINHKKYIGQHKASSFDARYKGSGKILKQAFAKYGKENFSCHVLPAINGVNTICMSKKELNDSERYYITYFNCIADSSYYNVAEGGVGSTYSSMSEEAKQLRNKKIAKAATGRKLTEETKKKISETKKGKYCGEANPNYGNHKLKERYASGDYVSPCLGVPHTEEYKKYLSARCKELAINKGEKSAHYGQH